jgi:Recombination endonuclease VII
MATKFCRDCGDYRPVEEFTKNARSRDGLAFYCRKHLAERSLKSREARRSKPRVQRRPPADLVIPDGHKWCADCGQVLPLADFVRTVATLTGYGAYCRPCHNARSRKSREKIGGSRTYHLTRRYGITAAEADFLLAAQDGLCAVCKSAPAVHVDHDHVTGAVRALLCFNCNGGLGQFKDDPDVLRAAAEYVEFHRTRRAAANGPTAPTRPGAPPVGSKAGPNRRRLHPGACAGVRAKYELREADG